MPEIRYTPWRVGFIAIAYFLLGPADHLALLNDQPSLVWERDFWGDTLAAGLGSFGASYKDIVPVIGLAMGIPALASVFQKGKGPTP